MSRRFKNHPKRGKTYDSDMALAKATLQETNKYFKQLETAWHKQGSHNLYLIKYEDYFPDRTPSLVDFLASKVGVALTAEELEELAQKHSLQENKKIADEHKNFWAYDKTSNIHGDHITGNGEIGGWKEAFSEDVIEFIFQKTQTYCDLFGYKFED
jgi:hypothetical protein